MHGAGQPSGTGRGAEAADLQERTRSAQPLHQRTGGDRISRTGGVQRHRCLPWLVVEEGVKGRATGLRCDRAPLRLALAETVRPESATVAPVGPCIAAAHPFTSAAAHTTGIAPPVTACDSSQTPPEESVYREGWCAGREGCRGGRAQGQEWRRSWAPVSRGPRPHRYAHPSGVSEACCGIIAL